MGVVVERRPVAMRNAALSVRNLKRNLRVMEALGVNPDLGASKAIMDRVSQDSEGVACFVSFLIQVLIVLRVSLEIDCMVLFEGYRETLTGGSLSVCCRTGQTAFVRVFR